MIGRLARQTIELVKDKKLRPYWSARGLIASLFFLFGILLREAGYEATEVLMAWIVVYLSQAMLLLSFDYIVKRKGSARLHSATIIGCSMIACASTLGMILLGTQLVFFSITTILLLPVLRESIHNGTLYIRSNQWIFGANMASLIANEAGKATGALLIFLFGYLSSLNEQWMAVFLLALIIISIRVHTTSATSALFNAPDNHSTIGPFGKGFVIVSSAHNGAFMAAKAILSLIVFDMLATETNIDNVITSLAGAISIGLLLGMALFQLMQKHIEPFLKNIYRNGLLTFSLSVFTLLSLLSLVTVVLFYADLIGATFAAYSLSVMIALYMALGSLFTLGTLQFLDNAFGVNEGDSFQLKKEAMHRAWIGSSFTPSLFLLMYLGLLAVCDALLAGMLSLFAILLAEIAVTKKSMRLEQQSTRKQ